MISAEFSTREDGAIRFWKKRAKRSDCKNNHKTMSLSKIAKIVFFIVCGVAATYFIAQAQTGNTGGSSGGTGGGQHGTGSGPAAWSPSAGGGTFTGGNPDANPYPKNDSPFFTDSSSKITTTTTTTTTATDNGSSASGSGKSSSSSQGSGKSKKKKSSSSGSPSSSASPSASGH